MSVRMRVWVLKAAFVWLLFVLLVTVGASAQRQDVSPAVRLAIAEASATNAEAISDLKVNMAVVQQTAAAAREELVDLRRAIWAMAGTLLLSLLTQIQQVRKSKPSA